MVLGASKLGIVLGGGYRCVEFDVVYCTIFAIIVIDNNNHLNFLALSSLGWLVQQGLKSWYMVCGAVFQNIGMMMIFFACKIDLRNAFNEASRQALLEECATHFPEFSGGFFGVMDNIPPCGTPWALLDSNKEFSRETLWVFSSSGAKDQH